MELKFGVENHYSGLDFHDTKFRLSNGDIVGSIAQCLVQYRVVQDLKFSEYGSNSGIEQ